MTDIQPITAPSPSALARRRRMQATFSQQLALIADRCGGEVARLPGGIVTLKGSLAEVTQMAHALKTTGRRVAHSTAPVPTGEPGRFLINVRLAPRVQIHAARQPTPRRKLPRWAFWSITGGAFGLVAALGLGIIAAVNFIMANLALASVVAIGIAVLAAVLVGNRATGGGKRISGTFQGRID